MFVDLNSTRVDLYLFYTHRVLSFSTGQTENLLISRDRLFNIGYFRPKRSDKVLNRTLTNLGNLSESSVHVPNVLFI